MTSSTARTVDDFIAQIRPAVRRERAYLVPGVDEPDVKLNQNENPYGFTDAMKQAWLDRVAQVDVNRYPTEQPWALMKALAAYTEHPVEGILVSNGSNEMCYTLGLALLEDGDKVVLPTPMFALYSTTVRIFGGEIVAVPPRADLTFDAEAILAAVHEHQPKLVVLTTPNNPTGKAMTPAEIEAIAEAAPGFVLVDEAYYEFDDHPSAQHLMDPFPNVMVMRTFSKGLGMAGLRLGYLLAQPEIMHEMLKARLPFMVDRLSEAAGLVLLDHRDVIDARVAELKAARKTLESELAAIPHVEVVPSAANFLLFRTPLGAEETATRLVQRGVLVRNVSGYPELPGYLRVSVGTPDENAAFLDALRAALA